MTDTTNPLDPENFYTQNVLWIAESCQLLKNGDTTDLHRNIGQRAVTALGELRSLQSKSERTRTDREEQKRLHHTLQVVVPAWRRSTLLRQQAKASKPNPHALHNAASRLAAFLLGMVAQSSLFPDEAKLRSRGADHDTTRLGGLGLVHRSVALSILRENASLFGPRPTWVDLVVVHPTYRSAQAAINQRLARTEKDMRLALRNKIIDLGVLTADEEQMLMAVLR